MGDFNKFDQSEEIYNRCRNKPTSEIDVNEIHAIFEYTEMLKYVLRKLRRKEDF